MNPFKIIRITSSDIRYEKLFTAAEETEDEQEMENSGIGRRMDQAKADYRKLPAGIREAVQKVERGTVPRSTKEITMMDRSANISLLRLFGEKDFLFRMRGEVTAWRKEHLHSGRIASFDGTRLQYYYALRPDARGSIVLLHGFCEFIGKYREMLYVFYHAGYNVFFHEQRGHGRSGRTARVKDGFIYVKDFADYEKDLKFLLDHKYLTLLGKVLPEEEYRTHPVFLFAHSMGGAVGTLFLEDYPEYFVAAVLSSPMHRMNTGGMAPWKIRAVMLYAKLFCQGKKPLFGQKGFDPEESFEDGCADSRARFDYVLSLRNHYPEYQMGGATFGWSSAAVKASGRILKNAGNVEIPVLLFQAGNDTLVDNSAQDAFAAAAQNTCVHRIEGAKHEIMNGKEGERKEYYREIFKFLMAQG